MFVCSHLQMYRIRKKLANCLCDMSHTYPPHTFYLCMNVLAHTSRFSIASFIFTLLTIPTYIQLHVSAPFLIVQHIKGLICFLLRVLFNFCVVYFLCQRYVFAHFYVYMCAMFMGVLTPTSNL